MTAPHSTKEVTPMKPSPNKRAFVIASSFLSLCLSQQGKFRRRTRRLWAVATAASAATPAATVTVPIIVTLVFAKWVYDVYKATYVAPAL